MYEKMNAHEIFFVYLNENIATYIFPNSKAFLTQKKTHMSNFGE